MSHRPHHMADRLMWDVMLVPMFILYRICYRLAPRRVRFPDFGYRDFVDAASPLAFWLGYALTWSLFALAAVVIAARCL